MSLFRGERPFLGPTTFQADGTGPLITLLNADGTSDGTIGITSGSFASSTVTNARVIDAEPILSAASVAVIGSVAGVRGNTTISAATTVTAGFIYGTQGKITIQGTLNDSSGAVAAAAIVGQLDLSAAVALTAGIVTCGWFDCGATFSAGAITGEALVDGIYITNTAAGTAINSAIKVAANATYLLDISNASYSPFYNAHTPTTLSGSITINTSAGVRYIACYTTE